MENLFDNLSNQLTNTNGKKVLPAGHYDVVLVDIQRGKPRDYWLYQQNTIMFVFELKSNPTIKIYRTVSALLKPHTKLLEIARQLGGLDQLPLEDLLEGKKIQAYLKKQIGKHYRAYICPNRKGTYSNIESLTYIDKGE